MRGFEKSTTDGGYTIEVDLRDKGLALDGTDILITQIEERSGDIEILISRKNLVELHEIITEALEYIGYPMKGYENE